MYRRQFLKISSLSLVPLLYNCRNKGTSGYDISVQSDMPSGHRLFEGGVTSKEKTIFHEYLVVGGGLSGLAAAYYLRKEDFFLYELSSSLGGTSGSRNHGEMIFAQGAHYDLAYPENFGKEALELLEDLEITEFNPLTQLWEFKDKKYIINQQIESQCLTTEGFRPDVIPDIPEREIFKDLLEEFNGKMVMPTRLIDRNLHFLNELSFADFLGRKMPFNEKFKLAVDYNMTDDYGGRSDQVSALAGIHYYACRPYFQQHVELFSPPEGNYYFVRKLAESLPSDRLKTGHVVMGISHEDDQYMVKILDINHQEMIKARVKGIIYCGNKHALKYIYPSDYSLFAGNRYAPWMIMNFIMDDFKSPEVFWQNEILGRHSSLLGFVDSSAQHHLNPQHRILSVYYCFPPEQRKVLADIETTKYGLVNETIRQMNDYFAFNVEPYIKKIFIKVMGHAMPIPGLNYLFNDKNKRRSSKNLVYGGVDNSRLPLLFEAIDSGIEAVNLLMK